ncbi:unnamed protein product, partial [Scytosiphon promiscuus]
CEGSATKDQIGGTISHELHHLDCSSCRLKPLRRMTRAQKRVLFCQMSMHGTFACLRFCMSALEAFQRPRFFLSKAANTRSLVLKVSFVRSPSPDASAFQLPHSHSSTVVRHTSASFPAHFAFFVYFS